MPDSVVDHARQAHKGVAKVSKAPLKPQAKAPTKRPAVPQAKAPSSKAGVTFGRRCVGVRTNGIQCSRWGKEVDVHTGRCKDHKELASEQALHLPERPRATGPGDVPLATFVTHCAGKRCVRGRTASCAVLPVWLSCAARGSGHVIV